MASKVLPPIPHLASRPKALALFGWTAAAAEWLALICLHSGVFTRAQYCHRFDVGPWGAHRFVRRMVEAGVAAEHPLPALRTSSRVCHVFGRDSRELRRFPRCFWTTEADAIQGQKAQIVQPCK